ncbi:PQQ-dependent sugar dehydrogenase [Parvibaculum sp. MBR-TMA-1.3b-4.2]
MPRLLTAFATAILCLTFGAGPVMAGDKIDKTIDTEKATIHVATFADELDHPWGLAFLPDGRMLLTERVGRLRIVDKEGGLSYPVAGLPDIDVRGQGGLLDVAIDPDFKKNKFVYLSFTEPGEDGMNGTAVLRGKLAEDMNEPRLSNVKVIFRQHPKVDGSGHFGSRLVFDRKGHLFITLGERYFDSVRGQAQDLDSDLGKIVRIWPDGSIPKDNPYADDGGPEGDARPEIWSYGHRNVQGAAIEPKTGKLWADEHGPKGGDEINVIEPGRDYGWPVVSFGVNYDGSPVGTGEAHAPGMTDPIYHWTPSIGVCGMAFYTSDAIPEWKGDLFVGGLAKPRLVRLEYQGEKITHTENLLTGLHERIRAVKQGPDGALYVLTDSSNGQILKITKAD